MFSSEIAVDEIKLVQIKKDGTFHVAAIPFGVAKDVIGANVAHYLRVGYSPPWCSYLAMSETKIVGTCAFKHPPESGRVEIAYFTFQEFEGRGIATHMAKELIRIAKDTDPALEIIAQTLREPNASTRILKKLGFELLGTVHHPEDGEVWEWKLIKT